MAQPMVSAQTFLLVAAHLVCPLIFFTNLTRNPYVTQISLLNGLLALALAVRLVRDAGAERRFVLPATPLDVPLLATALGALASWSIAYALHAPFFRAAIVNEGLRGGLFFLVNCVAAFYLAASRPRGEDEEVPLGLWSAGVLLWGLMWTAYPQMRGPLRQSVEAWPLIWDPYAAFLWAAGFAGAAWLCRRARAVDFLHLAMAVGFLASVYGVAQYFNKEFVWPHALNPYGGRAVSTFGNPNFLSSYNVVVFPLAASAFLRARGRGERLVYAVVTLALEAGLLSTLTRSSWLGAAVAASLLLLSPQLRAAAKGAPQPVGLLAALGVGMALLWPESSISSGYTPTVVGRFTEAAGAARSAGIYGPWHQRLLIWSCAFLMGNENPLTGKGFGLFELFYPFYQGGVIDAYEAWRTLRTHANNSHNELFETWAQGGLLGVGLAVWLWTTFAVYAWRERGRSRPWAWAWPAACGAAGMLADNMLNVSMHFAVPAFIFWWAVGTAASGPAAEEGRRRELASGAAARAAAAAAGVAALLVCWQWTRVWNREVEYFTGFKLLRQNALAAATKHLERSRAWGPPEVNALYELGNAYARAERFPDADRAYGESLKANAGYDEIYFNLGSIKANRLGQRKEAIAQFQTALLINPIAAEAYNALSALYLQDPDKDGEAAWDLLQRAIRHFPENPNHWHNLGFLLVRKGRVDEAEKAFTEALLIAPGQAVSEGALRALAAKSGRRPAILESLSQLRELEGRVAARDYSDATLALGLRLAAKLPEMAKVRFMAGSLLLVRGRPAEAAPHLEWVTQRSPGHTVAWTNLAGAYQAQGRSAEAAGALRRALEADPGNDEARRRLKSLSLP